MTQIQFSGDEFFSIYTQNAWLTECPDEFVADISLAIPPGADAENPDADYALLDLIGAVGIWNGAAGATEYLVENAATGTRFMFAWTQGVDELPSYWRLRREGLCLSERDEGMQKNIFSKNLFSAHF